MFIISVMRTHHAILRLERAEGCAGLLLAKFTTVVRHSGSPQWYLKLGFGNS